MSKIIEDALKKDRTILLPHESLGVCEEYGIPVIEYAFVTTEDQALKVAEEIGFPVVLKIVSPTVSHKSDVGGVMLGLQTPEDVTKAFNLIRQRLIAHDPSAKILGVLVQKMAREGVEVVIGATRDPHFGPVLMFGLGGVFVEVLKDVSFRVAPITINDAFEMIEEIKGYEVLRGIRGKRPSDIRAIANILLKLSDLMMGQEWVSQVDLNPVIVYSDGAIVVDARIILKGK